MEDSVIDYYDIMVIGRTGMGKSTTADKLLVANPLNRDYRGDPCVEEMVERGRVNVSDLSMWLISDAEGEIDCVTKRLKNIALFRRLESPHKKVNEFYMKQSEQTTKSQLISNETTMVRVLDVPGFFGEDYNCNPQAASTNVTTNGSVFTEQTTKSQATKVRILDVPGFFGKNYNRYPQNNTAKGLSIMREVLRIQAATRMNFKRILYFIPERGPLERSHKGLLMELEHMVHYFGKSIFECMVLVATVNPDIYQYLPSSVVPFSNDAEMKTRKIFQEALKSVLPPGEQLPDQKPPIAFISMNDTCEDIYTKIKSAPVICDGMRLAFSHQTCAKCGIKAKFLGAGVKEEKVACYIGEDPSQSTPYEESLCHPLIISKYWRITKVLGGIAHVITAKKFIGKWPDFRNPDDEVCDKCRKVPGTRGCLLVNTYYDIKGGRIFVDHKCDEPLDFVIKRSDDDGGDDDDDDDDDVHQPLVQNLGVPRD